MTAREAIAEMDEQNASSEKRAQLKDDREEIYIVGLGSYLPGDPIDNERIAACLPGVPVFDLMRYFGVKKRHFVITPETGERFEAGLGNAEMAHRAAMRAISDAGIAISDIDLIITTTSTPDFLLPSLARQLQRQLGIEAVQLFDLRGGCAAAIQGLAVAEALMRCGRAKTALICGAECMSPYYFGQRLLRNQAPDTNDMVNGLIFADGGAAMIVQSGERIQDAARRIRVGYSHSQTIFPNEGEGLRVKFPDENTAHSETTHLHKLILRLLPQVVDKGLADLVHHSNRNISDYRTIIVPQANPSLISSIVPAINWDVSKMMYYIGETTANIPGAAMVMALDYAVRCGRAGKPGEPVGIVAAETASWTYAVIDLVA